MRSPPIRGHILPTLPSTDFPSWGIGATAPVLLVGGTADPSWDGAVARRLTPHVLEVPDAHHGMLVPGPLARSAEVLGRVCTAVEEFVQISWPA
ncbi:hypothetical protein [Micromonospora sp. L32]|uniref:hypothetical protein n=1 Tax=Micromonospora TaxID=1873 RepID=UPI003F8BE921